MYTTISREIGHRRELVHLGCTLRVKWAWLLIDP